MRIQIFRLLTVLCLQLPFTFAQEAATTKAADPDPLVTAESDYILKDFHFVDGESLPELKLHYQTIGFGRLSYPSLLSLRIKKAAR